MADLQKYIDSLPSSKEILARGSDTPEDSFNRMIDYVKNLAELEPRLDNDLISSLYPEQEEFLRELWESDGTPYIKMYKDDEKHKFRDKGRSPHFLPSKSPTEVDTLATYYNRKGTADYGHGVIGDILDEMPHQMQWRPEGVYNQSLADSLVHANIKQKRLVGDLFERKEGYSTPEGREAIYETPGMVESHAHEVLENLIRYQYIQAIPKDTLEAYPRLKELKGTYLEKYTKNKEAYDSFRKAFPMEASRYIGDSLNVDYDKTLLESLLKEAFKN